MRNLPLLIIDGQPDELWKWKRRERKKYKKPALTRDREEQTQTKITKKIKNQIENLKSFKTVSEVGPLIRLNKSRGVNKLERERERGRKEGGNRG